MKRKSLLQKKRTRAQSLVEFALVLPLLLLVVYGLLEVGRLIFTYSIVISASREAVRYGSATGLNVAGGVPRYKDCAGIMAAAQNVDFLGVIDDANITIVYDKGPGGASLGGCPPASVATGDRITVNVTAPFATIIPLPIGPITARSFSARTIIVSLAVAGTALPPPTVPPPPPVNTATFTPTTAVTPLATSTLGTPTVTFTPSLTFTPSKTFTPTNTFTPTYTPTATATNVNCTLVTHSPLQRSGNTLLMFINNQTGATLNVAQVLVVWNSATGHTGTNTTLKLQTIAIGGTPIWGGSSAGPSWVSSFLYAAGAMLPSGTGSIVFTFDQTYDVLSSTDNIAVQFYNNGCSSYTLNSSATASCSVAGVGAINDLASTNHQGNSVDLVWTPSVDDIGGTNIYQSLDNVTWTLLGHVDSAVGTYLAPLNGKKGDNNYFRIRPINSCSNSPYSNTITVVK